MCCSSTCLALKLNFRGKVVTRVCLEVELLSVPFALKPVRSAVINFKMGFIWLWRGGYITSSYVNGSNINCEGITLSILLPSVLVHLLMDFTNFGFTRCKGWATKTVGFSENCQNTLTSNCCIARYLFDCSSQSMNKIELFVTILVCAGLRKLYFIWHTEPADL